VYGCKFLENGVNGWDTNSNGWDSGSSSNEGNLWDNYDEESEGARDNNGDGVADSPYSIPGGGSSKDLYPWCRKPAEMPYYIDYWNPYGESVILVNMSLASQTSKYIYLYYGYSGSLSNPRYKHNISEVSVFSDDFNNLNSDTWYIYNDCALDGKGNLSIGEWGLIATKNNLIPEIGEPTNVPYAQTINQSTYIVEARMNINTSEGNMVLLGQNYLGMCFNYWISVNQTPLTKKISLEKDYLDNGVDFDWTTLKEVPVPDLNHWIRLKNYIYRSWGKYSSPLINESKSVSITSIIYNFDSYADEGNVSYVYGMNKINGGSWPPFDTIYTGGKIGLGCGYSNTLGIDLADVLVDWIRVMKAPVIPPTITMGPVESVNYGLNNPGDIHSKNIVLPRQQPSDDPFYPGPVLRDFNYGKIAGVFNMTNLPQDEYTITATMGNASGECNATTIEFFKDRIDTTSYGKLTLPATEPGIFETKSLLITWHGGNLLAKFSSTIGNWTVNSMIIERGKKGIHVGLE
jgi:hypothetical protein